jgi:DNA-binding response OmpR family regulator
MSLLTDAAAAYDGIEAVRLAKDEHLDLIILDILLVVPWANRADLCQ